MTDKVNSKVPVFPAGFPMELADLFRSAFASAPEIVTELPGAGSDRRYWRLSGGGRSAVGAEASDIREAAAFRNLDLSFHARGVRVPRFIAALPDCSLYLLEDLGDTQLLSILSTDGGREVARKAMVSLADMQTLPEEAWAPSVIFAMDRRQVMWDLCYFKYEFLKPSGVVFDESALEDDFESFADSILSIPPERWGFMHRDCQSRNVMVHDGEPYWIDFQGGRRGPCLYDAVSFIWQARAGLPDDFRHELLHIYADAFCRRRGISKPDFLSDLPTLRLFRLLQTLGAYGFRGLVEHKAQFVASIPAALANLDSLCDEGAADRWPELLRVCRTLAEHPRFRSVMVPAPDRLTISVFSFSYKKGYPDDFSGNGGGFMFDCRAVPNPGRLERYKSRTGLDDDVIEFLEDREETFAFLAPALSLASASARRYIERGFNSLQLGFGCTGGRHRSVYSAEVAARVLAKKFPEARVVVVHRERGLSREVGSEEIFDGRYSLRHLGESEVEDAGKSGREEVMQS